MFERWRNGALGLAALLLLANAPRAASETADHAAKKPEAPACDRARFRAVVDVGHTAEVPGAMSARNAPEYEFNLRLAKVVVQDLMDAGFAKALLLVTDGPTMAGLAKRVNAANNYAADLFLSIHHDSVPDRFLEDWEYDGKPSHFSDRFKGHSIFISSDNPEFKESLQFARFLGHQLKDRGLQYTPHYTEAFMGNRRRELVDAEVGVYRYDQLVVLRSTQMPAALLEAGSIINRDEELALATPERQALIGAAATDAVTQFCAAHAARPQVARPQEAHPQVARSPAAAEGAKSSGLFAPLLNLFKHQ